jgi:hypothetical protein
VTPEFLALLAQLRALEGVAEGKGYFRFASLLAETRGIAREHMNGYYTEPGPTTLQTELDVRSWTGERVPKTASAAHLDPWHGKDPS